MNDHGLGQRVPLANVGRLPDFEGRERFRTDVSVVVHRGRTWGG
jgi:hypothetical protein